MSNNTPTTLKSSESKNNSPLDPYAEFQKLKMETEEINKKMMMGPPLFNSTGDSSNEMFGMVLNELKKMRIEIKEIRQEMKEMKEDVSIMKSEQENQKETLSDTTEIKKVLENVEENQNKLQEDVSTIKLEQIKQKEALNSINKTLNEIGEKQMKIQENGSEVRREQQLNQQRVDVASNSYDPNSQVDIRRQISGKWRNVDFHSVYYSAKFEGDTFMEKWDDFDSYKKFILGVKSPYGWTITVENNKIVQKWSPNEGEERSRFEYYIENERLQRVCYSYGKEYSKYTFERYANPDPE